MDGDCMTKEENIATLNEHLDHWKRLLSEKICDQSEGEKTIDALQNAIKALEPQYCGDCISREETLKALMDEWTEFDSELMDYLIEKVKKLPSVTPLPKMGRWEWNQYDANPKIGNFHCSLCHNIGERYYDYCPGCGAKMQEVEE